MTKSGYIPKTWQKLKICDIAQISSGGTPSRKEMSFWNGTIPWITTGEVNFNRIKISKESISELGLKNSAAKIFPKGTILIALYGQGKTRGKVGILETPATTNQACAALITGSTVSSEFLFQYLMHNYLNLRKLSNTGSQENLNSDLIKSFFVLIPPLPEQRKIAQILSTWDKAIALTEQLIVAKEQRKRGLMQQLLLGKRRYPEFSKNRWEEFQYGDLVKEARRHIEFDDQNTYHLISVRRNSGGLFHRGSLEGHKIKTKDLRVAMEGDFLISKMQVLHGATGLVTESFDGMYISGSYISLIPKNNKLDLRFLNWLSKTPYFYYQTCVASHGVAIEKMTFDFRYFLKLKIYIPTNLEEQKKIVSALSRCDQEIELLTRTLDQYRQQKKGLMQQLLTGKIRVK